MSRVPLFFAFGALALAACKPAPMNGATRLSSSSTDVEADGPTLECDCARLVPLAERPEWARVVRSPSRGSSCGYAPAGVSGTAESGLSVTVVAGKAATQHLLDRWLRRALATYPVVREQRRIDLGDGEATLAVAQAGAGEEVVIAARVSRDGVARAALAVADLGGLAPAGSVPVPSWLQAMAEALSEACPEAR